MERIIRVSVKFRAFGITFGTVVKYFKIDSSLSLREVSSEEGENKKYTTFLNKFGTVLGIENTEGRFTVTLNLPN
mgnify:CR=1 FL=1